jgi:hypothetical protein
VKVFENRILSRIFGPEGKEVMRGWETLCDEEFNNFYSSPNVIRMLK